MQFCQKHDNVTEHPVAFFSKKLLPREVFHCGEGMLRYKTLCKDFLHIHVGKAIC